MRVEASDLLSQAPFKNYNIGYESSVSTLADFGSTLAA